MEGLETAKSAFCEVSVERMLMVFLAVTFEKTRGRAVSTATDK